MDVISQGEIMMDNIRNLDYPYLSLPDIDEDSIGAEESEVKLNG